LSTLKKQTLAESASTTTNTVEEKREKVAIGVIFMLSFMSTCQYAWTLKLWQAHGEDFFHEIGLPPDKYGKYCVVRSAMNGKKYQICRRVDRFENQEPKNWI
jgi:hypothetical protein